MRRAQINQVFIFIMALLIIGVIVLVFSKSLLGILGDKCVADSVRFKENVIRSVALNNDYGSVHNMELFTPCDYHTLCLVDSRAIGSPLEGVFPGETIIKDSVEDGVLTNVFLIKGENEVRPVAYISQLHLYTAEETPVLVLCNVTKGGKFKLITRGEGRTTLVSFDE